MARPTSRESPAFSSANPAIASKPRYDSTATEMAPTTTDGSKAPSPTSGESTGRIGPVEASAASAMTTKTTNTAISTNSTIVPTRAATRTPTRLSAVVAAKAITVKIHAGTAGIRACRAMPENR